MKSLRHNLCNKPPIFIEFTPFLGSGVNPFDRLFHTIFFCKSLFLPGGCPEFWLIYPDFGLFSPKIALSGPFCKIPVNPILCRLWKYYVLLRLYYSDLTGPFLLKK